MVKVVLVRARLVRVVLVRAGLVRVGLVRIVLVRAGLVMVRMVGCLMRIGLVMVVTMRGLVMVGVVRVGLMEGLMRIGFVMVVLMRVLVRVAMLRIRFDECNGGAGKVGEDQTIGSCGGIVKANSGVPSRPEPCTSLAFPRQSHAPCPGPAPECHRPHVLSLLDLRPSSFTVRYVHRNHKAC